MAPSPNDLIVFPAYQLLVVKERLGEQEAGELPPEMDPMDCALGLLVDAELTAEDYRSRRPSGSGCRKDRCVRPWR